LNDCVNKKENDAIDFINYVYNSGYSLVNQILALHNLVLGTNKLSSEEKSQVIITLANIDQNLIKGCDEITQMYKLAYFIMHIKSNLKT